MVLQSGRVAAEPKSLLSQVDQDGQDLHWVATTLTGELRQRLRPGVHGNQSCGSGAVLLEATGSTAPPVAPWLELQLRGKEKREPVALTYPSFVFLPVQRAPSNPTRQPASVEEAWKVWSEQPETTERA